MTSDYSSPGTDEWTQTHTTLARREGWDLVDDGQGHRDIQPYDLKTRHSPFKDEDQAILHVTACALEGSILHQLALQIHERDHQILLQQTSTWRELQELPRHRVTREEVVAIQNARVDEACETFERILDVLRTASDPTNEHRPDKSFYETLYNQMEETIMDFQTAIAVSELHPRLVSKLSAVLHPLYKILSAIWLRERARVATFATDRWDHFVSHVGAFIHQIDDIDKFVIICNQKRIDSTAQPDTSLATAYSISQTERAPATITYNGRALATIKYHSTTSEPRSTQRSYIPELFNIDILGQRMSVHVSGDGNVDLMNADGESIRPKLSEDEWFPLLHKAEFLGFDPSFWCYYSDETGESDEESNEHQDGGGTT